MPPGWDFSNYDRPLSGRVCSAVSFGFNGVADISVNGRRAPFGSPLTVALRCVRHCHCSERWLASGHVDLRPLTVKNPCGAQARHWRRISNLAAVLTHRAPLLALATKLAALVLFGKTAPRLFRGPQNLFKKDSDTIAQMQQNTGRTRSANR